MSGELKSNCNEISRKRKKCTISYMILSIIIFPKLQWRIKPTYVVHVDREWKLPNTLGGKHSQNLFFNDKTTLYVRKKSIPNFFY